MDKNKEFLKFRAGEKFIHSTISSLDFLRVRKLHKRFKNFLVKNANKNCCRFWYFSETKQCTRSQRTWGKRAISLKRSEWQYCVATRKFILRAKKQRVGISTISCRNHSVHASVCDHFAEKEQNHEGNPKSGKINSGHSHDHEQSEPRLQRAAGWSQTRQNRVLRLVTCRSKANLKSIRAKRVWKMRVISGIRKRRIRTRRLKRFPGGKGEFLAGRIGSKKQNLNMWFFSCEVLSLQIVKFKWL